MNVKKREDQTRQKQKRIPPGMPRLRTSVTGLAKGKRGYWAKEAQFQELLEGGYEFVGKNYQGLVIGTEGNRGSDLGSLVSRSSGSEGNRVYLMQIDETIYNENQAVKQGYVDDIERAMIERAPNESSSGMQYFPKGSEPKIRHGRVKIDTDETTNDAEDLL
mgnify:CR=1 FL=1